MPEAIFAKASFNSVQFSCSITSESLWPHGLQHTRLLYPSPPPRAWSNLCSLSESCHPTISSSVIPFPSCLQGLFQCVSSSHQVAKVLEFQLQHPSFQWTPSTYLLQDGLVGSSCSPRDSQESPPTPQFKSINSSVLSFLYSPNLLISFYFHVKTKTQRILNFDSEFTFYVFFFYVTLYPLKDYNYFSRYWISIAKVVHILCMLWQYSLKIHYLSICMYTLFFCHRMNAIILKSCK